ncbi:MAG: hypothetical protein QOD26_552 [Betaproteobacteria bacterium]|jgi:uncharacterized membrane protein YhaH (DUF805 family)|nr:hypothetical protein [Betaproteobacteria bacterium]
MATATPGVNPYAKPNAAVTDAGEEVQEVKVFSTSGRIGRVRYIAYGMGIYILFGILGALLGAVIGSAGMVIAWIAIMIIGFMLTIQRCHDFNATGWLSLLVLVPLVNLIFWFIPGTDGENQYGARTPPNGVGVIIAACIVPIIAVVGILAAIALPAYQQYQVRAKAMQQQQQQQQAPQR